MLDFLNAYGLVITIASGILGFIAFFESRRHPFFRRSGSVIGIVALVVCLMVLPASLVMQLQSSPESVRLGTTPVAASSNPQSETTIVPTQAQATPTPTPRLQPSPTSAIPRLKSSYSGTMTWAIDTFHQTWYVNSQDQKGNINVTVIVPDVDVYGIHTYFCKGTITSVGHIQLSGQAGSNDTLQFDGLRYPDGHIEGNESVLGLDYQIMLK